MLCDAAINWTRHSTLYLQSSMFKLTNNFFNNPLNDFELQTGNMTIIATWPITISARPFFCLLSSFSFSSILVSHTFFFHFTSTVHVFLYHILFSCTVHLVLVRIWARGGSFFIHINYRILN